MTTPSWQSSPGPAGPVGAIPPPPPFPPGDPRLAAVYQQQVLPYGAAPAPARRLGQRVTVALVAGVGAVALTLVAIVAVLAKPNAAAGARAGSATPPAPATYAQPKHPTQAPGTAVAPGQAAAAPLQPAPKSGIDLGTSPSLKVALPKIEAFVEQARGHRFLKPVKVTPLADKAFLAQLTKADKPNKAEKAEIQATDQTFEALHLIPRHSDLAGMISAQDASDVGGFYDPVTKRLYVRSATLNPLAQTIVAHELTHALDDQYFDLAAMQRKAKTGDRDEAVRSLIEGDARSVENRFKAAMVPAERKRVAQEADRLYGGAAAGDAKPGFLDLYQAFPYELGSTFVDTLRASGGAAAVDRAFRTPPTSTLQVMVPKELYLDNRHDPVPFGKVTKVKGATILEQDDMGALGLGAVLSEKDFRNALQQMVIGYWDGDHYVTTRQGSRTCVRDTIVASSPIGRDAIYGALTTWAGSHAGATVTKGSGTTLAFTSCVS